MQVECSGEWDFIQNLIRDLAIKLELLPNDLKNRAIQLLQEILSNNDIPLITNQEIRKTKKVSGRNIKQTKKSIKYNNENSDLNEFLEEVESNANGNILVRSIKQEMMDDEKWQMIEETNENGEIKEYFNDLDINAKEFLCEMCAFVGSSVNEINKHKRSSHGIISERICHTCGKVLPNFRQLQSHIAGHLEEMKLLNVEQDEQKFECELCGSKLRSKWIYMEHIGRHFNRQIKTCDICGKQFPNSSQLNAHKHAHDPPKVPCFICDKKFRNKHKLSVHLLMHSGQRDFACPECPYATYVKHNLQKHCLKRHNLKYPLVRQSIKRFHPDEFETSTLNDPVARSYISKILIKGECFPIDLKIDLKEDASPWELANKINSSELVISNEVEIKENKKRGRKSKMETIHKVPKVIKNRKEKLVKSNDKKITKNLREKNIKNELEKYKISPTLENDILILNSYGYNTSQCDDYNSIDDAIQCHPETVIDCVEETIYA